MTRADRFVTVEDLEIHYSAWGDEDDPPVVCVHGLSRVGRDFDPIAAALADTYRVVCPDMPGRGLSEWSDFPEEEYTAEFMAGLLVGFCETLGIETMRWIGTSMGGALGMALAGGPLADRITHLVVNDVGPGPAEDEEADEGIDRIVEYLTNPPAFDRLSELEAYYRDVYEPFSEMTDEEWCRFTTTSARRRDDGRVTPNYDTRVVEPLLTADDGDQWEAWDAIEADVFVLHGKESDILSQATFEEMKERKPDAKTLEIDCGHAPALNVDEQIEPIRAFLAA